MPTVATIFAEFPSYSFIALFRVTPLGHIHRTWSYYTWTSIEFSSDQCRAFSKDCSLCICAKPVNSCSIATKLRTCTPVRKKYDFLYNPKWNKFQYFFAFVFAQQLFTCSPSHSAGKSFKLRLAKSWRPFLTQFLPHIVPCYRKACEISRVFIVFKAY